MLITWIEQFMGIETERNNQVAKLEKEKVESRDTFSSILDDSKMAEKKREFTKSYAVDKMASTVDHLKADLKSACQKAVTKHIRGIKSHFDHLNIYRRLDAEYIEGKFNDQVYSDEAGKEYAKKDEIFAKKKTGAERLKYFTDPVAQFELESDYLIDAHVKDEIVK